MGEHKGAAPIHVLLVHSQGLLRTTLARYLASEPGLQVTAECATKTEVLEALNRSPADLILLDCDLAESPGDLMSAARGRGYTGRFLIVTASPGAESSATALSFGASGVFLKSEAPERLVQAIRLIAEGGAWVDPIVLQLLADRCLAQPPRGESHKPPAALGDREQKVLTGILGGLTNRKIAAGMEISEGTVKNLLQRLFRKAGVRTRSQLVRLALEGSLGASFQGDRVEPRRPLANL